MTDKEYTTEFQKALNDYIKLGFNQDECSGFMHGFHKGAEAVKKLNIDDVSSQMGLLAFLNWYDERMYHTSNEETALQVVKEYKANCC